MGKGKRRKCFWDEPIFAEDLCLLSDPFGCP